MESKEIYLEKHAQSTFPYFQDKVAIRKAKYILLEWAAKIFMDQTVFDLVGFLP
ncbi:MAG: hypothetical protein GY777_18845 [Candidatus Brocadiaceae bacterium]|nr:hypothetical protein [Candidatus Brocadiaceae bacterium]